MAIYDLRCSAGHVFEVIQSFQAALPDCRCGASTTKLPSRFAIGGQASAPPPAERMPQTWRGTHRGDREYLAALRRTAEARVALEQRHPELAGDSRPILAHEGAYESTPLRQGDPVRPAPGGHAHATAAHASGHSPAPPERHSHPHPHP